MHSRHRLAQNLAIIRALTGMSQEALALRCGLKRTYIGALERSEVNTGIETIDRIAAALEIPSHTLLMDPTDAEAMLERLLPRVRKVRKSNIRILIVDDHDAVREGLAALLKTQEGFEVVAEAGDGSTALAVCRRHAPDIVVMDINMPKVDGIEAVRRLASALPSTRAVMLSFHAEAELVRRALHAGAMGFVTKGAAAEELIDAIRAVSAGRPYLSRDLIYPNAGGETPA